MQTVLLKCCRSQVLRSRKQGIKQLLIEVRAADVNPMDWKIRKGNLKLITSWSLPPIMEDSVAEIINETRKK